MSKSLAVQSVLQVPNPATASTEYILHVSNRSAIRRRASYVPSTIGLQNQVSKRLGKYPFEEHLRIGGTSSHTQRR